MSKTVIVRDNTLKRHGIVFRNYIRILKKYGAISNSISKSTLYAESGDPFGYDSETSGKIIRNFLKLPKADLRLIVSDCESEDALELALKLAGNEE